jgi:hypothetical protein
VSIDLDSLGSNPNLVVDNWSFRYSPGFKAVDKISLVCFVGYTAENVPGVLKNALVAAAAMSYKEPDQGIKHERVGDYAVSARNGIE